MPAPHRSPWLPQLSPIQRVHQAPIVQPPFLNKSIDQRTHNPNVVLVSSNLQLIIMHWFISENTSSPYGILDPILRSQFCKNLRQRNWYTACNIISSLMRQGNWYTACTIISSTIKFNRGSLYPDQAPSDLSMTLSMPLGIHPVYFLVWRWS